MKYLCLVYLEPDKLHAVPIGSARRAATICAKAVYSRS